MKKRFLLFGISLCLPFLIFAQKGLLYGKIYDSDTQKPLIGAVVTLKNARAGAVSAEDGSFALQNLPAGTDTLLISLIGYQTHSEPAQIAANDAARLDFKLESGGLELREVMVTGLNAHRRQTLGQLDLRLRPIVNSQEILRVVPGLFMGQHAGGGKAEQIFLRGFDIDHGTDIRLTVDGMPVNMVSHAHGQGYADLHFIIPELVDNVQFEKGPYHADKGNFTTAGWVDFRTREILDRSFAKLEVGQYGTARGVAAVDLLDEKAKQRNQSAYLAGEYSHSDSYFDAPQFFNRANVQGRYSGELSPGSRLNLTGSHFWSRWNHSGQIPDRAVSDGSIGFYGSIDPTEGGETSRSNLNAQLFTQTGNGGLLKNQVFYSKYNFELYSNFTFFLEDPVNGDQIRQKEGRNLFGYNGSYSFPTRLAGAEARSSFGVQYRQDLVKDVELANTRMRSITEKQLQLGDINEVNLGIYVDEELQFAGHWTLNAGLRYDFFRNFYVDRLENSRQQSATAGILSPKINLNYTPNEQIKLYLNTGRGFHSNDTRVAVPQNGRDILPAAYGADLGIVWKPAPRLFLNMALWYLWLNQEFVYVGDAGVVEAGGRSRRYGAELSARYQLSKRLFADLDANWTRPRSIDEPAGEDYLPLAPVFTSVGGLTLAGSKGFSGSLRYRYMGRRPANEDNSLGAEGYFIPDLQLNYARNNWELSLNLQNLLNTKWKETQFATESRLFDETAPVEEIHFTPGTPFFARAAVTVFF